MQRVIVILLSILAVGQAQFVPLSTFVLIQVKIYLGLSDAQMSVINAFNIQYQDSVLNKAQRQAQVQLEISQETAKPTLDPMAIGLRYLELEAIRRELQAEKKKAFDGIQAILTAEQKTKAATLQNALSVYSTACAALDVNIINLPLPAIYDPNDPSGSSVPTAIVPLTSYSLQMCGNSGIPLVNLRAGDFAGQVRVP